jgi:hypothetical protein
MGNLPGITISWTRNPPEEGDSAGNYKLINSESIRERGFHRKLPDYLRGFRPVRSKFAENLSNDNSRISSSKSYILTMPTYQKIKYEDLLKIENKPDPALLGTSYLSN